MKVQFEDTPVIRVGEVLQLVFDGAAGYAWKVDEPAGVVASVSGGQASLTANEPGKHEVVFRLSSYDKPEEVVHQRHINLRVVAAAHSYVSTIVI